MDTAPSIAYEKDHVISVMIFYSYFEQSTYFTALNIFIEFVVSRNELKYGKHYLIT